MWTESMSLDIDEKFLCTERSENESERSSIVPRNQYEELFSLYEILFEDRERLKKEVKSFNNSQQPRRPGLDKVHVELLQRKVIQQEGEIKSLNETIRLLRNRTLLPQPRNEKTPVPEQKNKLAMRRNSMIPRKVSSITPSKPRSTLKQRNIF